MPQYCVAVYHPDDYDSVRRNRGDDRGDTRAQPRDDYCRGEEVRLRPYSGRKPSRCGPSRDGKVLVT